MADARGAHKATPEQRATIYSETMGLRITYNPGSASIEVEARPACTQDRVGGPTGNLGPRPVVMESGWSKLRRVADYSEVFR
jgi:hypothetical protein